ncbi:hypothetical protein BGZ83_005004 [Gryganskiella cystojenkinii]|nr:hypothetical protein BGZ83_005004 [Gryganskiella cystojenkinii]
MKPSNTVLSLVMVLAIMGNVNGFEFKAPDELKIGAESKPIVQTTAASSAGRSGTKLKRLVDVAVDSGTSDGEYDGSSSSDDRYAFAAAVKKTCYD